MDIINLFAFFLTFVQVAQANFLTAVCRANSRYCVQKNSKGTWCYAPEALHSTPAAPILDSCIGDTHIELQGAFQSHLRQNLSIAYYNAVDNQQLGGVDYDIPTAPGIVRLCLSNSGGDGILQTLCFDVSGDNSMDGNPWCLVTGGPPVVSDGCYPEKFNTTLPTTYSSTAPNLLITEWSPASTIITPFVAIFVIVLVINIGI
ncbi:hypothetical protein M413DRAFT_437839 [Hebeloma cylindrosporum]|uniref:Uncharacterized protein n=1 Tax=Hebeloma cylindrosporum TaxID=76867 RepID=A0A0C3CWZ4_HEBCY|nr:hypothetical protein M413DRAFT_437839 [Hebeloma cylindrosporum h7]